MAERFDPATAGWVYIDSEDFAGYTGAGWQRREDGRRGFGFIAERRHVNPQGIIHGGMLMAFADHALGLTVRESIGGRDCATIQFNTHFLAAVKIGDFVTCTPEITRGGRSIVFIRGIIEAAGRPVAAVDGIWKVRGA